jgi:hypothetical protein
VRINIRRSKYSPCKVKENVGILASTSFRSRDLMSCDSTSLD